MSAIEPETPPSVAMSAIGAGTVPIRPAEDFLGHRYWNMFIRRTAEQAECNAHEFRMILNELRRPLLRLPASLIPPFPVRNIISMNIGFAHINSTYEERHLNWKSHWLNVYGRGIVGERLDLQHWELLESVVFLHALVHPTLRLPHDTSAFPEESSAFQTLRLLGMLPTREPGRDDSCGGDFRVHAANSGTVTAVYFRNDDDINASHSAVFRDRQITDQDYAHAVETGPEPALAMRLTIIRPEDGEHMSGLELMVRGFTRLSEYHPDEDERLTKARTWYTRMKAALKSIPQQPSAPEFFMVPGREEASGRINGYQEYDA
ncbi:hypothetical protein G7046_g6192 [Stylonectria norvegica]|nr:hypothetical protein G7046_g6192 [Stylonectria norvegica]